MKKVLLVLVAVLAFSTINAQKYKLKGFGGKINGFVFTDSTIVSTKNGEIIKVITGVKRKVKSDKVTEYFKVDEDGSKYKWQIIEMSKNSISISILVIDSFTEQRAEMTLRAKRIN